jgi:hypothetical protein
MGKRKATEFYHGGTKFPGDVVRREPSQKGVPILLLLNQL